MTSPTAPVEPTVVCVGLDGEAARRETLNSVDLFPRSFKV